MSRFLIINADDLGYCLQRNQGILACYKANAITSSSLLVNGAAAEDAAAIAKDSGLPIGLHLNLTEGRPISPKTLDSTLTDSAGCFYGKDGFREQMLMGAIDSETINTEIEAQLHLFSCLTGQLPHFVDGHQHAHIVPGVCDIFARALERNDIKWTRLPLDDNARNCDWMSKELVDFFHIVNSEARSATSVFSKHGVRYPEFVGLTTMGSGMTMERIKAQVTDVFSGSTHRNCDGNASAQSPEHYDAAETNVSCSSGQKMADMTCELMVHPGFMNVDENGGCGSGPDDFSKSSDREHEMSTLMSQDMKMFLQDSGIKLCSYHDLK